MSKFKIYECEKCSNIKLENYCEKCDLTLEEYCVYYEQAIVWYVNEKNEVVSRLVSKCK